MKKLLGALVVVAAWGQVAWAGTGHYYVPAAAAIPYLFHPVTNGERMNTAAPWLYNAGGGMAFRRMNGTWTDPFVSEGDTERPKLSILYQFPDTATVPTLNVTIWGKWASTVAGTDRACFNIASYATKPDSGVALTSYTWVSNVGYDLVESPTKTFSNYVLGTTADEVIKSTSVAVTTQLLSSSDDTTVCATTTACAGFPAVLWIGRVESGSCTSGSTTDFDILGVDISWSTS